MPRIRTIKPEFWTDTKLSRYADIDRLVFLCLWSMADDEGRVEGDEFTIRGFGFPIHDVEEIKKSLMNLHEANRIVIYTQDNAKFIQVCAFERHQYIQHPKKSKLPPPPELTSFMKNHEESQEIMNAHAGSGIRDQGSGIREAGSSPSLSSPSSSLQPRIAKLMKDYRTQCGQFKISDEKLQSQIESVKWTDDLQTVFYAVLNTSEPDTAIWAILDEVREPMKRFKSDRYRDARVAYNNWISAKVEIPSPLKVKIREMHDYCKKNSIHIPQFLDQLGNGK